MDLYCLLCLLILRCKNTDWTESQQCIHTYPQSAGAALSAGLWSNCLQQCVHRSALSSSSRESASQLSAIHNVRMTGTRRAFLPGVTYTYYTVSSVEPQYRPAVMCKILGLVPNCYLNTVCCYYLLITIFKYYLIFNFMPVKFSAFDSI